MVNLLASRNGKKDNRTQLQQGSKEMKKTRSFHHNRRLMSSSEEEELIGNESNDDDLKTPQTTASWRGQNSDTEVVEDTKKISEVPSRSVRAIPNIIHKDLTFEERLQTLTDSDSSDQKSDSKQPVKWLCKPRLDSFLKQDDTHITTQPTIRRGRRKRAVISSSSDEKPESDEEKLMREAVDIGGNVTTLLILAVSCKVPVSLKMMVKRAKKHRKYLNSSSEESESDEHYDSDSSARIGKSDDSESSQIMQRRSHRNASSSMILKNCCVTFFNEANRNMLMETPRINDKVADFIISNRPFRDYEDLESRLLQCPRGSYAAEQYLDFLENRSILENILDDCRRHSEEIYSALDSIKSKQLQMKPKLLSEECKLHPYQQIGLNWLMMMHKLKLNAILADEMVIIYNRRESP
ncbi:unnamed protein product [Onchocerca flexuosa]|uniref:Uncharacterized protein n=1 Tax=Onchocerca flexuosa TaxID=387005 RepID=A0A183HC92_9BILA|nr:unnamed protein product [Onchocerca flexuosa]